VREHTSFVSGPGSLRRKISQAEIDLYSDMLAEMQWRPRFCVIVIVDNDDCSAIECAHATIASVCSQAYCDWRLILVGDEPAVALRDRLADGRDDVRTLGDRLLNRGGDWVALSARILDGFDGFRERIEISALGRTDQLHQFGEYDDQPPVYLGILAAGDELGCDAFLELAVTSGLNPDCDFFYSDELCINPATGALEEFLKPQWSPDLLLSTNYIGRFWAAKRDLLERAEVTLPELLHLGEFDAVLRCTEQSCGIRHIPSVLCKAAMRRLDSEAGMKRSLQRAVERRGIQGEVTAGYRSGTYRLRRRVAQDLVSIIISTCAARGLIKPCIASLREVTAYSNFEIVCVDNIPQADKHSKDWLRANADKVIEINDPFNWSYFNNRGVAAARGQLLLFLNDDVEIIDPGWLDVLVGHAQRPEVGVVGAQLLFRNRTVQHGGMFLASLGHARHAFRHRRQDDPCYFGLALMERNVSAVTGACLMTRHAIFADLGGFNEAHDIINNDLDYCLKARARGLLCIYTPHARLVHHERASRMASEHYDDGAFNRQWWTVFGEHDPYHNPRLSRAVEDIVPETEPVEVLCVDRPLFTRDSVHNILVVALDDMAGCIGSIAAIQRLRQVFPSARIHVLGGPWSEPVWLMVPEIDEFITFDFFREHPPLKALEADERRHLMQRLQRYQFDIAIDLHRQGDTRAILQCTGARFLAGLMQNSEFPRLDIALQWGIDLPSRGKRRHFSSDFVSLVDAIADGCEGRRDLIVKPPTDRVPSARLEPIGTEGRPLVCVDPTAADEISRWPSEYFAELIDLLVERDGVQIALVGLRGDGEIAARVQRSLRDHGRVSNIAGMLEIADLVDLLMRSTLFVGNNSGALHLAAALGVPTVGIHPANVNPGARGPLGRRTVVVWRQADCSLCQLSKPGECKRNLFCLTELRPVDVYPVCKRFLRIWADRTAVHYRGSRKFEEEGIGPDE
jgi:ADP-heptose:LPS heptosyltransferase/GT2 family glycosyltransferase